jgi:predicted Zn-dependent protease
MTSATSPDAWKKENEYKRMRFISLTWTDGLSQTEAILFVRTVHEAILQARQQWPVRGNIIEVPEIKPFGYWVLEGAEPSQVYGSMEWYINKSFDQENQQLLGRRYLQLVLDEPWQHQTPHYDLAVIHQPLFDEVDQHSVFGLAVRGRAAVLSVYPLYALDEGPRRYRILRRLVAHYLGQVIGIPIPGWREQVQCLGSCAMQPAGSLAEWVGRVEEESRMKTLYCQDCQRELSARLASNHFGMN